MLLPDYIEQFLGYLDSEKRYSRHTADAYNRDLWQFFTFMNAHKGEAIGTDNLNDIDENDVRAYLTRAHMSGDKERSTLNRQLSSVRSFFKWLEKRHGIINSRIKLVGNMKTNGHVPRALSPADAWRFIDQCQKEEADNFTNRRNYAIMIALYGLGLRISEALSLNREDGVAHQITVLGKGNKERVLPLPDFVQKAFQSLVEIMPSTSAQNAPLFTNPRGDRLTARTVQKTVADMRLKMNLPDHLTPHALRHSFASHLLAEGADLRIVQALLGHANLDTTQRYLDADFSRLLNVHKKAHPLK